MKQNDKHLLLQDLCARLPYGVIVDYKENEFEIPHWKINVIYPETMDGWIGYDEKVGVGSKSGSRPFNIGEYKPYLRTMSSMTEEEKKEFGRISCEGNIGHKYGIFYKSQDYLNSIHVDYRGLIPKGLALEALKGMYD